MAEQQSSGLRFDIYERIHLPDEMTGIRELDEIELSPHIQVQSVGDHTVLKGELVLSGHYIGVNDSDGNQSLEYKIPVEITLPMNRSQVVGHIQAEIENFDVDLLSAKSLNVTGVLTLRGFRLAAEEPEEWKEEEEIVFVHRKLEEPEFAWEQAGSVRQSAEELQAAVDAAGDSQSWPGERIASFAEEARAAQEDWSEQEQDARNAAQEARIAQEAWDAQETRDVQAEAAPEAQEVAGEGEEPPSLPGNHFAGDDSIENPDARTEEAEPTPEPQAAEDPQEVKIAFSGKKLVEKIQEKALDLKSLLHKPSSDKSSDNSSEKSKNKRDAELGGGSRQDQGELSGRSRPEQSYAGNEQPARFSPPGTEAPLDDALEWKKLFLHEGKEESFRRLRMRIVQKNETIELIAEKYSINPREIILLNKLGDQEVLEGQVIYIPK
ncbi:LysM peptidoglycan-binding domain-containing protein [Ferviditalea candida]|uniref:LysM peptidoglycan-binding domain-containing protein n=1 Tax=Ferviditalea candida TaxID=3108399 RepID=A0ABU5ZD02_9BACL|nr:LysM peptidoglycan-binding domain-containing protein [Paenibacillaceae bacterium T2]